MIVGAEPAESMLELDDALTGWLHGMKRKSRLVEMIFFGGLTLDEASAVLGTSLATARRELKLAKAWLYVALADGDSVPPRP